MEHSPIAHAIDRFNKLIANYRKAQIELVLADEYDDEESDRLTDVQTGFERQIIEQPAPDFRSVLAKLEILNQDGSVIDSEQMDCVISDVMILAGIDRAVTFEPRVWLYYFQRHGGRAYRHDGKVWLSAPAGDGGAANRLAHLAPYEREAVVEHLEQTLEG